jgi:hypothetical protein
MQMLQEIRSTKIPSSQVNDMISPGGYSLTAETPNQSELSGSNTRHLFKNLYGETLLTFLFFSEKNVTNVQNILRYLVHKETGYTIDTQSNNELLIIMRSIFLEYHAHPPLVKEDMNEVEKQLLLKKYTDEVQKLNDIVINTILPKVMSQLQQYVTYLKDASEQPIQMERPQNASVAGQRDYRSVTQVLLGGGL